jgi:hypothetical protein
MSQKKLTWKLWAMRILMTLFAIDLGAIGVFANNGNGWQHHLHDKIAMWLVYIVLVMIIGSFFLLDNINKEFILTSIVEAGLMALGYILFMFVHYLSLTAFEIIEFGLAFTWLIQLLQFLRRYADTGDEVFTVTVE